MVETSTMKSAKEENCMDFSVKMFRVVGCWPNRKETHKWSERLYLCYTAITYGVLLIYTLILAYGLTIHYSTWHSLEEAIEDFIVFATGLIVLLKITLFLQNQNRLQNMINYINTDLNKRELRDEEDTSVIKACIKHERSLTKTYVSFGYCITILYTASSIIKILKERATTGELHSLPLKYPFEPWSSTMYYILYFHQMVVMILNGHIGTLADTFFSCLAYYVCGHFKIIKKRIAKEGGIITRDFVLYHNEMIRLTEKLQTIFGPFLLFQLGSNTMLICLGLLQITQTGNIKLLHYIKCLIYVSIKLSQLFLYCWYGQQLIKKSFDISFEAYSGMWYEIRDKRTCGNLQMVMCRSQKSVQIKTGAYFVLSLPTLARVIHSAYSFFTMIKSTQKE